MNKTLSNALFFLRKNLVFIVLVVVIAALGFVLGSVLRTTIGQSQILGASPESHANYTLMEGETAPSVNIEVKRDMGGWNVELMTENFTFSPDGVNSEHVPGEGHAHIYIDDQKLTRLYSEHYHIPNKFASAGQEIFVTLNTNDHKNYTNEDGETVRSKDGISLP